MIDINWEQFLNLFFLGSMGALSIEILKAYELKGKLHHKKYKVLFKSLLFWILGLIFLLVAGFLTWAMHENNPNVTIWQAVFTGMGISALTKKIGETFASIEKLKAGEDKVKIEIKDLFK